MADYTKPDFEEVQERVHLFETSSEREMTESDTVLGYQHMNNRYLQKEHDDVWRDDIKERQREWKEKKKAHDRRKKEIERAWHNNTRERKTALEARKGSNSPKENNYYRNYDLKEMEVFIKNSDRGGNSKAYNAVATELELYNHIMNRKDSYKFEGLEVLIRLDENCREYLSSRTNPHTTNGKIRKAIIGTISDKVKALIDEERTKAVEEATRSFDAWKAAPGEETLKYAFQSSHTMMFHYLNGNLTLNAQQKQSLDENMVELLKAVKEQEVDDGQSNTMASRFFNTLGWSENQPRLAEGEEFQNEVQKSALKRVVHHTINSLNATRLNDYPENGSDAEKQQWMKDKSAIGMIKQLTGLDEQKKKQHYSAGFHGKGTYLAAADKELGVHGGEEAEKAAVNDCWDYGANSGSIQLTLCLNENTRMVREGRLDDLIDKFSTEFKGIYDYLKDVETIKRQGGDENSKEYRTMFASFFGYNTINAGHPGNSLYCKYIYLVTTDRKAFTISRDYSLRIGSFVGIGNKKIPGKL